MSQPHDRMLPILSLVAALGCGGSNSSGGDPDAAVPPVTVSIALSPDSIVLPTGGDTEFVATVMGSADTNVSWSIEEAPAGGLISATGLYSAPRSPGIYRVIATSDADSSKTAAATVTVSSALDGSFGQNGTIGGSFGGIAKIWAMATQPDDGKRVVGGESLIGEEIVFAVARYEPNGALDQSFGNGGVVTTSLGGAGVRALAIQADGKIVVAGASDQGDFVVARYLADGTLDSTFGTSSDGTVLQKPGSGVATLNALVLQDDLKIVVGGSSVLNGIAVATLMRFLPSGAVDETFGSATTGIVQSEYLSTAGFEESEIFALTLQSTGEIVAGGGVGRPSTLFLVARYDSGGILDTSFSSDGFVVAALGSGEQRANAIVVQPTGEIVAGGFSSSFFAITRYTGSGIEDTSFSGDGIVITAVGNGGPASIQSLLLDGSDLVAGGVSFDGAGNSEFTLARYDSTGSPDSSFGVGGIATTALSSGQDGIGALGLESGKLIAAGFIADGPRIDFALAQFDAADGSVDTSFDIDGLVTTSIGGGHDEIAALAVQSNQMILAGGSSIGVNGSKNRDFLLARFAADGSLDTSFGASGVASISISGLAKGDDLINAIAIQDNGKILVAGSTFRDAASPSKDFALARYLTNGSLDLSFGIAGTGVVTETRVGEDEEINDLVPLPNGEIIVAGTARNGANEEFIVARYQQSGVLDPIFGGGLAVTTTIGTGDSQCNALALAGDTKVILVGSATVAGSTDFALARYNIGDGSLDATFGNSGILTTAIGTGDDFAEAIAIQTDGKFVVSGTTVSASGLTQFAVARYSADGVLDAGFGAGGIVLVAMGSGATERSATLFALALQPSDGAILLGGASQGSQSDADFSLVRLLASDGSLDPSFGVNGLEYTPFSSDADELHALGVLSDGTIVGGGFTTDQDNRDFHLAGYAPL